jgi:RES domain-containing protein
VTPLPLGGSELVAWRMGGPFRVSWNSRGIRAAYCSIDPVTAILEVAAHKSFMVLDTQPLVLTAVTISDRRPQQLITVGRSGAGQQMFGNALLARHKVLVIPSAVCNHGWTPIFVATTADGSYALRSQELFALDAQLHPPARP